MIPRPTVINQIDRALGIHPIAALLGPRQCGKTTVARMFAERQPSTYFDLEDPVDVRRLSAPMTVLQELSGLVIIDEVQRRPEQPVRCVSPLKTCRSNIFGWSIQDARNTHSTTGYRSFRLTRSRGWRQPGAERAILDLRYIWAANL